MIERMVLLIHFLVGVYRHIQIKVFFCFFIFIFQSFIPTFLFCVPEDLDTSRTGTSGSFFFTLFTEVLPPPIAIGLALAMMIGGLRLILHGEEEAKKNAAAHALYDKSKSKDKDKDQDKDPSENVSSGDGTAD